MSNKQFHIKWRNDFRNNVFRRDKNTCKICDKPGVDAHHIINRKLLPNGGYVISNGICLCETCHLNVERFLMSKNNKNIYGFKYSPYNLFKLIDSSFEKAKQDSENLMPQ